MQSLSLEEALQRITSQDPRFHRDAYLFLREALDHAQKQVCQSKQREPRHITGQELLAGLREYALSQFGPMVKTVLNEWGIHTCEDFGEMVFNMVDQNLLCSTETDTRDDFKGGYDFDEAFCRPFLPRARQGVPAPRAPTAGQP